MNMRRCIDVVIPQSDSTGSGRADVKRRLRLLRKTMRVYDWLVGEKLVLRQNSKQRRLFGKLYFCVHYMDYY